MSPHPAVRRSGACTGSLWKSHARGVPNKSSHDVSLDVVLAEANERQRAHEFCVLVGNALWSYSDAWAYAKGDPPTSEIQIVGASAWNPPSASIPTTSNVGLASEVAPTTPRSADFLIVTYSGTHVRCSAPTPADKDEWLAALHAGLEGNILENRVETLMVLGKRRQADGDLLRHRSHCTHNNGEGGNVPRKLRSWKETDMMVQSAIAGATAAFEAEIAFRPFVPPLPRDQTPKKSSSFSDYGGIGNACPPTTGYRSPCEDWSVPPSDTHCTACGRYPPEHAMRIDATPLPEFGMEVRADLCHDCCVAQGVLRHVGYLGRLYEAEARDRAAIRMAWDDIKEVVDRLGWENAGLEGEGRGAPRDSKGQTASAASNGTKDGIVPLESKAPTSKESRVKSETKTWCPYDETYDAITAGALLELVGTKTFLEYRQRSKTLDSLCRALEKMGRASDFLENVRECAHAAEKSSFYIGEQGLDEDEGEKISMKKEAFKVAGDMSAALKLLYEYALPPERRSVPVQSHHAYSRSKDDADMLASILEFFLDLCDEGQTDEVAFFWPQICHIHMQMLPPRDVEELIRVELMEDFLLTVATRYSVHLALDLVWGLTADLEESLGSISCNSLSRLRRFAVLRFVSELESLLFDFEGGWGGGMVSLRGMLSPCQHQATMLREAMSLLQLRRRFGSYYLSRSVRLDKLREEALESLDLPLDTAADDAVKAQIARNASYFSSHIVFSRKLGDIAERLRFTSIEQRSDTLRHALKKLNACGKILGGDPLNILCGDGGLQRTIHIPINEGHVFRSKERTPVLLLAEVVKDFPEMNVSTSEHVVDLAAMDSIEEKDEEHVSNMAAMSYTEENGDGASPKQKDPLECSSQASESSSSTANKLFDGDGVVNGSISCPESPIPTKQDQLRPSIGEGVVHHSPRVLTLTPRASEATNVTEEGKEMMADMIASLIENKRKFAPPSLEDIPLVPPPPLDNIPLDGIITENDSSDSDERKLPHQPTEIIEGKKETDTDKGSMAQPLPEIKGPDTSITNSRHSSSGGNRDEGRRISALGFRGRRNLDFSKSSGIDLSADLQFRRDVLLTIMERGMRGNAFAKGAATAAQRAIQAMDRKRAIALMNEPAKKPESAANNVSGRGRTASTELIGGDGSIKSSIDEGEVMEALRLLIIQNQVAQENLSPDNAVKGNGAHTSLAEPVADRSQKGVDAGEVDRRLAGCGQISSSVLSALRLWKGGIVSNEELLELVQKDLQFLKQSAVFGSADESKLVEDSAFWSRFSFGERWIEKKARISASSPHGSLPEWNLIGYIVKSNDDLRQEAFVMQLIRLCEESFRTAGLDLWVHPYNIVATGRSTGIIECVTNAMSFDSLKKRPGYGTDGLAGHFRRMTEIEADPFKALNEAKQNFVRSLAAYSLMSYLFMFKDRHNGNLLLDTAGHVIHIDFGFVFGIAPGGSFSFEQSTPFKITEEMLEVMGGLDSPLFSEFVTLFCCGFLALQAHADTFLTVVEVTCRGSNYHCFDGKDPEEIVTKLRERFCQDLSKSQTVAYALDLIKFATTSYGTKQYDYFQYLSQGIAT